MRSSSVRMTRTATQLAAVEITAALKSRLRRSVSVLVSMLAINHSLTPRSRKALPMTETELRLIAAPAMIGLSSQPKNG